MDTMTLMHLRAIQNKRANGISLRMPTLFNPAWASPQTVLPPKPIRPAPRPDLPVADLVDLGLRTVVPVQYQIVKSGGAVLESPAVPGVVKILVGAVVVAAAVSGAKEVGRTIDNLLS